MDFLGHCNLGVMVSESLWLTLIGHKESFFFFIGAKESLFCESIILKASFVRVIFCFSTKLLECEAMKKNTNTTISVN